MTAVSVTVRVTDKSGHSAADTATCEVQDFNLVIGPGQNVVALVNAAPAGTAAQPYRILVNGDHRITTQLAPKAYTDLTLNGTLLGDVVLTGWAPDGAGRWSVSGKLPADYGMTDPGVPHQTTGDTANSCKRLEDLFINGIRLRRVMNLAAVTPGSFYGDYTANKIYIGQDPAGKTVEMSKTRYAVKTTAQGVRLLGNASVKHFANPSQQGAISLEGPDSFIGPWVVQWNHAVGVKFTNAHRSVAQGTYSISNGQLGWSVTSSNDVQLKSLRVKYNNGPGEYLIPDWESGGIKASRTLRILIWDCWWLFNNGIGIWLDINNDQATVTWNRSEDNSSCGIRHEIGQFAHIARNVVLRCGHYHKPDSGDRTPGGVDPRPYASAGINIHNANALIEHNTVLDCGNGIFVQQRVRSDPAWQVTNVVVRNNKISSLVRKDPLTGLRWVKDGMPTASSGVGSFGQTAARNAELYSTSVRFENNTYGPEEMLVRWTGSSWSAGTLAQAQSAGQEAGSILLTA